VRARLVAAIAIGFVATLARADDSPAFDRPGIAFAPATIGAGAIAWEQGLPDVERDSGHGIRTTTWSADSTLRVGLTSSLEVQLQGSAWNRLDLSGRGVSMHEHGGGDTTVAVKWAPTMPDDAYKLAILGSATIDTGSPAFTSGRPVYSLGATGARKLGEDSAVALYANVDRSGGANTWTVSPNVSFPIAGSIGGYVEAGRIAGGGESQTLAGGGFTLGIADRVQFDLFGLAGLTSRSPDFEAGFGVSAIWK
jgi:hypothetical protein